MKILHDKKLILRGAVSAVCAVAFSAPAVAAESSYPPPFHSGKSAGSSITYSQYLITGGAAADAVFLPAAPLVFNRDKQHAAETSGLMGWFSNPVIGLVVVGAGIAVGVNAISDSSDSAQTSSPTNPNPNPTPPTCMGDKIADTSGNCICPANQIETPAGSNTCAPPPTTPTCMGDKMLDTSSGNCVCPSNEIETPPGSDTCAPPPPTCMGDKMPDTSGNCVCPSDEIEESPGSNTCVPKTLAQRCADDNSLERRVFSAPSDIVINEGLLFGGTGNFVGNMGMGTLSGNRYDDFRNSVFLDMIREGPITTGARDRIFAIRGDITVRASIGGRLGDGNLEFDTFVPEAGDVIAVLYHAQLNRNTLEPGDGGATETNSTPANMRGAQLFRLYNSVEDDGSGTTVTVLRMAAGENTGSARDMTRTELAADSQTACAAAAPDEFFLDGNWTATDNLADSRENDEFPLRGILGGLLDERTAFRAGGFSFALGGELKDMHMEYKTETSYGGGALRAYSGYIKKDGMEIIYRKASADYAVSAQTKLYAAGAWGELSSAEYGGSELFGYSGGVLFGGMKSGNWMRLNIGSPFGDNLRNRTRFSADARLFGEKSWIRIGAYREISEAKTGARILYRREF